MSFRSARLKLARARHHLTDAGGIYDRFVAESSDGSPYTMELRERAGSPTRVDAIFRVERALPDELALTVGDFIHNARSSLDHIVAECKRLREANPERGGFPLCTTRQEWDERVANGKASNPLAGLEDTPGWALVEDAQPFQGADPASDPLKVLSDLDNADKHRVLHPAFAYPQATTGLDLIEVREGTALERVAHWQVPDPLADGTLVASVVLGLGAQPNKSVRASRREPMGFAIGDPQAGRTRFEAILSRVEEVIAAAEQAYQ